MKRYIALFVLCFVIGFSIAFWGNNKPALGGMGELERLHLAGLVLQVAYDSPAPSEATCNITSDEAGVLIQFLKVRLDEKLNSYDNSMFRSKEKFDEGWTMRFRRCEERCLCGVYQNLIENYPEATSDEIRESVIIKASQQTRKQTQMCASMAGFCGSQLLESLRAEVAQDSQP